MKRAFLMLAMAGALAGCGGEAAHVGAAMLVPDPQAPTVPSAQHDPANAGMMDATPPAGRRRAD
ncbi:MAG: hypothetical protein M3R60_05595 [Pseudomonadota bacterium]|nr:hypothetical protein [Pseudomonadota bacterium]